MKSGTGIVLLLVAATATSGCAVGEKLGWHRDKEVPTAVVQASCEAATATLKGRQFHGTANRACVEAKTRQNVD